MKIKDYDVKLFEKVFACVDDRVERYTWWILFTNIQEPIIYMDLKDIWDSTKLTILDDKALL